AHTYDETLAAYISGAPRVLGGRVLIGYGGSNGVSRGYITAYDAAIGKQLWRFYTVPGDPSKGFENKAMEMAAQTWSGEWWKFGGGGNVWHAMAYDAKYDRVYIGTGNGFPWNQKIRSPGGGDNLFLASIVALDRKTGKYVWHYQANPGVTWDYNNAMDIQLATLNIGGKPRDVLMHAPKNGFFYVIDRKDGKLISAEKFAPANWASRVDLKTGRPVEDPRARYENGEVFVMAPSAVGAHNWQSMSFNPRTGLVYIPQLENEGAVTDPPDLANWRYRPGMFINTGLGAAPAGTPVGLGSSNLVAFDPVAAKVVWKHPRPGMLNGGTITTGGNLIFQGWTTGRFVATAADTGKELWSFDAQTGVQGNPITYSVGGRQYVTVITGFRSTVPANPAWDFRTQKRRVLTFALGGKATLPKAEFIDQPILDDPSFVIDPAKARAGGATFNTTCGICHGLGAIAGGGAPDLRRSALSLDPESFRAVVHDGALIERGMARYEHLDEAELEALRHYIRLTARQALAPQAAATP
ncbi:MAG: PQQ-binding-like beta-propeller repeat protein, partial [Phenylobacterium sp.]